MPVRLPGFLLNWPYCFIDSTIVFLQRHLLPIHILIRENYVLMGQFGNNNIFEAQLSIMQDMSTVWKNIKGNMHSGLRCYFIPKIPLHCSSSL